MPIVLAEPSEEFLRVAAMQAAVYQEYAALSEAAPLDPVSGLGGKLLYAGDLTQNSDLLRAANIAGAASLTASGDPASTRAAMRDGTIDFLVTSLDEALRILKNEIRKRQPVSVAVALEPDQVTRQMLERGVLPDRLRVDLRNTDQHIDQPGADFPSAGFSSSTQDFLDQGALGIPERRTGPYGFWCASRDSASWMPKLDDCVRASIALDLQRERWLRLAPRYLGRTALKLHGVALAGEDQAHVRSRLTALSAEAADGSERSGQMLPALEISFGLL